MARDIPLGVVIVGAGRAAEIHSWWYPEIPDARVLAYVDLVEEKARARAEANGLTGPGTYYTDYRQALARPDVDIFDVMPTPPAQPEIAMAALEAGKHVLVEKPMAQSLAQCDKMIEIARRRGVILGQVHQNRLHRTPRRAKLLVQSGRMGQFVRARALGSTIHTLDTLIFIFGRPEWCAADWSYPQLQEPVNRPPAWLNGVVRFPNGVSCSIEMGYDAVCVPQIYFNAGRTFVLFELIGERIGVSFAWVHNQSRIWGRWDGADEAYVRETQEWFDAQLPDVADTNGHRVLLPAFIAAVRNGGRPLLTGEDGRQAIELFTGLYKAAATSQRVDFPIRSDDPFYSNPLAMIPG
ncbi:MAG: Gfo/Idh/MocA family oxidoreductase [Chloroflexi bacterium]|nr:Gfo/Idh/MocA family oxidoreductase [Chloroflexota bacterium]